MTGLRLVSFALAGLASMLLFVRMNDHLDGKHWSEVGERLSIVAILAIAAGGSLEAYIQDVPFGWRVPLFMTGCASLVFFLIAGRHRR